jgi:lysophospholipase L1-like esterase
VEDADEYRLERRLAGGSWNSLATTDTTTFLDDSPRNRGATYEYRVTALRRGTASLPSASAATVVPAYRLTLIGDSNLARGVAGTTIVATSYLHGDTLSIDPDAFPDHPKLLSGRVMALRSSVEAVNHGISSTRTGTGTVNGRPNALHAIGGITRFEAEVLGLGYPWTAAGIARVNAFAPTGADFGYYALGINDIAIGTSPETIRDNIAVAMDRWIAAGLPPARFMVATLGPRLGNSHRASIPAANELIRALAADRGVSLIDIAALVSDDDGLTWKSAALHTGDGLHYSEATLDLVAAEIHRVMGGLIP